MNAQQLSRRHVMQLAAGALASAGLVYSSLEAPHRTTLPEKAWLSAVMSFRRRSVANLENLCRERLKGREPKKGLRSRIRSCAIMHADTKRD